MSLANKYDALFQGRRDVYGSVEGGCIKKHLTTDIWVAHLYYTGSVGVYPMVDNKVHWGCVDIDLGEEMLAMAQNLQTVLAFYKLTSWIEKSKGKGFHIFVFANDWVPAKTMRRALIVACEIAGVPPTEVNPKQEELSHEHCPTTSSCRQRAGSAVVSGITGRRGNVLDEAKENSHDGKRESTQERETDADNLFGDDRLRRGVTGGGDDVPGGHDSHSPAIRESQNDLQISNSEAISSGGMDGAVVSVNGRSTQGADNRNSKDLASSAGPTEACRAFGNYLNIPYAKHWYDQGRRVVLDGENGYYEAERFVDLALASRCSEAELEALAGLYKPKYKERLSVSFPVMREQDRLVSVRITPLIEKIMREGPLPGNDRSTTLARLAHECATAGLTPEQCFVLLENADQNWGKFHLRKDCEEQLWKLVNNAYPEEEK